MFKFLSKETDEQLIQYNPKLKKNQIAGFIDYWSTNCFLLLIIILPFNLRYIFNFAQIKTLPGFREFKLIFVTPIDLLMLSLLIITLIRYLVERKKIITFQFQNQQFLFTQFFSLIFIIFGTISLLLINRPLNALYLFFRFIQPIIFFLISPYFLKNENIFNYVLKIIFWNGLFQTVLAFFQIIFQKSIGFWYLGESVVSSSLLGSAKFEIFGQKFLRAYGTFPHPNLLAVFLLSSIAALFQLYQQKKYSIKVLVFGFIGLTLGIILTFSRTGLVGWLLLTSLFIWFNQDLKNKIKKILQKKINILLTIGLIAIIFILISPRICLKHCLNDNSFDLRQKYLQKSLEIISHRPIWGVGYGQFVDTNSQMNSSWNIWENQPVHNLYLLIAAETGIPSLIIFLSVIWLLLKLVTTGFKKDPANGIFYFLFFIFLFLGLFDHYFWTLTQGQLLFWLSISLFASQKFKEKNNFE